MNTILLLITLFNVILLGGFIFGIFLKIKEKKEDHRINKGLQTLQNKIAILEDLSDKTDEQLRHWVHLLDQKTEHLKIVYNKCEDQKSNFEEFFIESQKVIQTLREELKNKNTYEPSNKTHLYVKAAKLANAGASFEEILNCVDLTPAEINMIIKVNKDQLQFADDQIPDWMNSQSNLTPANSIKESLKEFSQALENQNALFKNPLQNHTFQEDENQLNHIQVELKKNNSPDLANGPVIKPYEFRRIITK